MSIAILVDNNVRWEGEGANRHRVLEPPPAETLKTIRELVAATTGFNGYDKDPVPTNTVHAEVLMDAHAADLGMAFYTGKQFPAAYQGGIFSAQHGFIGRSP